MTGTLLDLRSVWRWCALAVLIATVGATALAKEKEIKVLPRGEIKPDQALIYVLRPAAGGFAVPAYFFANDELLGVNHGNGYFFHSLPPGKYLFWSKMENVDTLELEVEAGKAYYIQQKTNMGVFKARTSLVLLSDKQGEELLQGGVKKLSELTDKERERGREHAQKSYARAQEEAARERSRPANDDAGKKKD